MVNKDKDEDVVSINNQEVMDLAVQCIDKIQAVAHHLVGCGSEKRFTILVASMAVTNAFVDDFEQENNDGKKITREDVLTLFNSWVEAIRNDINLNIDIQEGKIKPEQFVSNPSEVKGWH